MIYSEKFDKKKLIALRIVLTVVGGVLGGIAAWQYFVAHPDAMRPAFSAVIISVTAVLIAALLCLSAKPLYRLFAGVFARFSRVSGTLGAKGIVAAILGVVAAGFIGFLTDVALRFAIDVITVRVLADVLVALFCAVALSYAFIKWVTEVPEADTVKPADKPCVGYLLTAECFTDERVFCAAQLNNVKVSDNVFEALYMIGGDAAAGERLKILLESGKVGRVKSGARFENAQEYVNAECAFAHAKRLKPITISVRSERDSFALAMFAEPTEDMRRSFVKTDISGNEEIKTDELVAPITIDK